MYNIIIYVGIHNVNRILLDTNDVSPQKRHKKHKHKKHKKKKLMHDDSDTFVEISTDADRKKSFRIKMKKEDERKYVYYTVFILLYLFFVHYITES